jgi:vitamin B12 transporter
LLSLSDANTLKFRASLGSGFRAPSPFEVDYNAGPFAYPPASTTLLSEENSEGYELGIEFFGGDRLTLEVVYFDQDIENAIEFDLATFSGYVQSQGVSNSQGVELGATVHLTDNWQASGNYTYNDTEQPDGLQRLRRPKHLANLGLNFVSDDRKWLASGFYRSARDTVDSNGFARSALEDYGVFDLSLRYRYSENIEIFARLENAFDEQYQEVLDYNSADRSSYIGVKLGF